jgi:lipopolysaccharide transport system ATP-binding protein
VAAHLQPDILLVDEVLAVGDAAFQKKCLGKMQDVTKEGRTVLFVSHNMGSMSSLCKRAIWLDQGRLRRQGAGRPVIDEYLAESAIKNQRVMPVTSMRNAQVRSDHLVIHSLEWLSEVPPKHGEPLAFRIHFEATSAVTDLAFGLGFSTMEGIRLFTLDSDDRGERHTLKSGQRGWVEFYVEDLPIVPGVYSLDLGARSGDRFSLGHLAGFATIEVLAGPTTPDLYICFPGAGVRKTSSCRWNTDIS